MLENSPSVSNFVLFCCILSCSAAFCLVLLHFDLFLKICQIWVSRNDHVSSHPLVHLLTNIFWINPYHWGISEWFFSCLTIIERVLENSPSVSKLVLLHQFWWDNSSRSSKSSANVLYTICVQRLKAILLLVLSSQPFLLIYQLFSSLPVTAWTPSTPVTVSVGD